MKNHLETDLNALRKGLISKGKVIASQKGRTNLLVDRVYMF